MKRLHITSTIYHTQFLTSRCLTGHSWLLMSIWHGPMRMHMISVMEFSPFRETIALMMLLKRALVVGLCWSISDRWPTRWSYLQMLLPKISLVIGSWSSVFCNQQSLVLRLCRWSLVSNWPKKTDDQCWFRQYHLNFWRWPSVGTNESVISHILLKTTSLLLPDTSKNSPLAKYSRGNYNIVIILHY